MHLVIAGKGTVRVLCQYIGKSVVEYVLLSIGVSGTIPIHLIGTGLLVLAVLWYVPTTRKHYIGD